jgi:hypothetical protein
MKCMLYHERLNALLVTFENIDKIRFRIYVNLKPELNSPIILLCGAPGRVLG